jgi:ankyrin repeat protein
MLYYVLYYTLAAFGGFTAAVRLLVDSGADPDKRDKDGWTALRYILYYILYYTPDKRDKDGWTALRLASRDANASSYSSSYSASRDAREAATLTLALLQAVLQLVYSCKRICFTSTKVQLLTQR